MVMLDLTVAESEECPGSWTWGLWTKPDERNVCTCWGEGFEDSAYEARCQAMRACQNVRMNLGHTLTVTLVFDGAA